MGNYDLFFNQPILINSFINYIKQITMPNIITIYDNDYPLTNAVSIFLGKRNKQQIFFFSYFFS